MIMNANWKNRMMLVALLCCAAAVASASQEVDRSYPVTAGAEVQIECLAGSLTIEGSSGSEVTISGTLGDGVEDLEVDVDDDGISIEVEYDEDYHGRQSVATDLTLRIPVNSPLSAETVSASISVSGLDGEVDLESVSGSIRVSGTPRSLDVETVSGDIEVENAGEDTEVSSVSGSIRIVSLSGSLDAENVSGAIVIEGGMLQGGDFETVSGNITCSAVPTGQGDIDMETMNGTIELLVLEDAPASFHLETFSGSIENAFGPEPERTSKYTPEKQLRFNTGSGGPAISLSSFSGTIKLVAR
jgi:DUF4097 and DUF4098 domain-containing protein YvlB